MKSSRLLKLLMVLLALLVILNAVPFIKQVWQGADAPKMPDVFTQSVPSPSPAVPAAIAASGQQWGYSTCYIGATEGSSRFNMNDLLDLGINTYHIYGGMSRWEAQNDSGTYGLPTIAQIKANPNAIDWKRWDDVMTNPADGSDYSWEPAPRWQGSARTLLGELQSAHIRVILDLRNRDDHQLPSWAPDPPRTSADWNEWWEHVFATVYWLNVRNHYNIVDFEVQNEPNVPNQGWTPEGTEADYFAFVRSTYDAISYVFSTYLPGRAFHVYAPATSGGSWPRDALQSIPRYFDSMDIHTYGNMRLLVEQTHTWMNQAGHADMPLWVTEWGSYTYQYNSEPFGISLINTMIVGSFPGNDYVYGSTIFALYDFATNATGLIDYKGERRTSYYAMRMGIRALQGCRPTYLSRTSNRDLQAITTKGSDGALYLLIVNQNARVTYALDANLSSLRTQASGTLWQYDARHLDTVTGHPSLQQGNVALTIPPNGAVLLKLV